MNFPKRLKTNQGFTLLEFLIYIAVVSVVSLLIGGSLLAINNGRALNDSRAEVNSVINIAMSKIKDDLKNATKVSSPVVGESSSTLTMVVNSENITYSLDAGGILKRTVGNTQPAPLNSDKVIFTTASFEHIQNTNLSLLRSFVNIRVNLTAEFDTDSPTLTYSQSNRSTFSLGKQIDITRPTGDALITTETDHAGDNIPKTP